MDRVDEAGAAACDWAVPASALAHGLRTPLNVLKGYASLLASGELGALHGEAATAVDAVRRAVGDLERRVALLRDMPPTARPGSPEVALAPVLADALAAEGFAAADGSLEVRGVAWPGWRPLFAATAQVLAAEGAEEVEISGSADGLAFAAAGPRAASGDGELALLVAGRLADAGGLGFVRPPNGGAQLRGARLISGVGATTFVITQVS